MTRTIVLATAMAVILVGGAYSLDAFAQGAHNSSAGGASNSATSESLINNLGQDRQTLDDYIDRVHREHASEPASEKKKRLAAEKAAAQAAADALHLSCKVTDGVEASKTQSTVKGQKVTTRIYEVSCANAMGYFLVARDPGQFGGFSCFSVEAQRLLDEAKGITNGFSCELPANKDIKAMAGRVMAQAGTSCTVDKLQWMGQTKSVEYTEVACANGKGYLLDTPLVGKPGAIHVLSCADAALKGLTCKLTKTAPPPAPAALTLQTFKDALVQHGITCTASHERVMGQENALKRYVVEFQCPQYPKGLVAFIPLQGNTAKFQTEDCAAAAKRHLMCKFAGAK